MREEQRITIENYNKIAASWTSKRNPDYWSKEFSKFQELLPAGSVFELGCGSGIDSRYFSDAGYNYTGIDRSEELLKIAKQNHPKNRFLKMDLCRLGLKSNLFDGFWAAAVFLHIPKEDIKQALLELKRVLKKNAIGFIALKDGHGEELVQGSEKDDRRFFAYYSLSEFGAVLNENKFEILSMSQSASDSCNTSWLVYFVRSA